MVMHIAIVYVVSPRNTFAVRHQEARGGNEIAVRNDYPRVTCVEGEGEYEERLERSCV